MISKIKKKDENFNKINKEEQERESNEITIIKRTLENNTHIVLEDIKLKRITSWRKSKAKFLNNLIYNILTFGILHLFSLHYPNLYIKLYCNPWPAKECDYFLVENIYGQLTLCLKIHKKINNQLNSNTDISKDNITTSLDNINLKYEYNSSKKSNYSFIYKSITYLYNEETNEICPMYMNLSKMTNKQILNKFSDGLSTENIVSSYKERYGLNEYIIDMKIPLLYLYKNEFPSFIIVFLIALTEFLVLGNYVSLFTKLFVILVIFSIQFIIIKKFILNKFRKEYTLDGEKIKPKVKRKYLLKENNKFFVEINNADLLPGDVIYLKSNDYVPCDCIIIEGECIANASNLIGSTEILKKSYLKNNNDQFNYKINNPNILYHGMKILKTFSKLKEGFISVLCINTGSNTYKANQFSNILYKLERKKQYNELYNFFGGRKKVIFIYMLLVFILSFVFGAFYLYSFNIKLNEKKAFSFLYKIIIRILCKSLMPVYFITHSIMMFFNLYRLRSEDIVCFDKSRLLISGNINTILFSKTGTLSHDSFEINSYHPITFNINKQGYISFKNYSNGNCKKMNTKLINYYRNYLDKKNENYNIHDSSANPIKIQQKQLLKRLNDKSNEYISLFLECLLSCTNIEKYNMELFGNNIETSLFEDMKWDIKPYYSHDNNKESLEINDNKFLEFSSNNYHYDNKFNLIKKSINDIFPKNYYKITNSSKYDIKNYQKRRISINNFILERNKIRKSNLSKSNKNLKDFNFSNFNVNNIIEDISNSYIDSYKLRIYKKFIKKGTFNNSAIVYNFITKQLRFMVKGMPEDILDKCDKNLLPDNLDNIISFYRRNGFIVMVCAGKLINIDEYNDLNGIDYYMNNLNIYGFTTLKNKLKDEIKKSIKEIKQFNCNLIISSGDNEYNCLSTGFNSGIIDNKNVFVFDIDENINRLIMTKIYNSQYNKYDREETKINFSLDKNSKQIPKMNNKNASFIINTKENSSSKKENVLIRSSQTKKSFKKTNESIHSNKSKQLKNNKEPPTPQLKLSSENNKSNQNKLIRKLSISKYLKVSKSLVDNSEREKINGSQLNQELSVINKDEKELEIRNSDISPHQNNIFSQGKKNQKKYENKEYKEETSFKKSKNSNYKIRNIVKYKYMNLEKYYYYNGIFKDYNDLNDNCIYCISGKAFSFLYKNKKKKDCKFLLEKIYKNCKIFFNMTSLDKSLSVDFFREHSNTFVCNIGECQSDVDSIMTSNIGINFRKPNNRNTILCHFYTINGDILCIKNIIKEGRVLNENTELLEMTSFLCTLAINSYVLSCLIRNSEAYLGQLNFLEIEIVILSISSFIGEPEENISSEPLVENKKLLRIYYIFNLIGILLIKLIAIYFFCSLYRSDKFLGNEERDKIFITYYFVLCIEFIICIIYSFNWISFYRKSPFTNFFLLFFSFIFISYMIILICLNSSNLQYDFLKITYFEFSGELIDSFADKNRIWLSLSCILDFIGSIIYSLIIYYIFKLIAKKKKESNNKDNYKG